jgi:hypothetical protein
MKQLMAVFQDMDEPLINYYNRFKSVVENTEQVYGPIAPTAVAALREDKGMSKAAKEKEARERMLAVMFMDGGNKGFKHVLRDLENDYALGAALYPAAVEEAFQVMKVYEEQPLYKSIMKNARSEKGKPCSKWTQIEEEQEFMGQFVQGSKLPQDVKEQCMRERCCFKCGKKGHKAFECKTPEKKSMMAQVKEEDDQGEDSVFSFMN